MNDSVGKVTLRLQLTTLGLGRDLRSFFHGAVSPKALRVRRQRRNAK